jgi:hypothetical protein
MFPWGNCDWNDDVRKMITDGASAEEAYQRLGKHILDGPNSFLALKEEEKPEKELEEFGDSLNVSLLPVSISKILSDVSSFNGLSQGVGLSSLLCFIGGQVGHRVKIGYRNELPFLYIACIGNVGSGKSHRFNSLKNDVFAKKIKEFFDTEIIQTNVNKYLLEGCEKLYLQMFCLKRKVNENSLEEEEYNNLFDLIKTETSTNPLYNIRNDHYVLRCLKDTYKQIFENKKEIKARSYLEEGGLELDHLASGYSSLFSERIVGENVGSVVFIKLLTLVCPSLCFYYDELIGLLAAEKSSDKFLFQHEYLLSMYQSGSSSSTMSHGCANIRSYVSPVLCMFGNLTTGSFYSDCVKGKLFENLSKKGFFGRMLLCEDTSPRKTAEHLYAENSEESDDRNEEAFSLLANTLINIENSFKNPIEFLLGHIRIPMDNEEVRERAIRSVGYWSDLYCKEASDYAEGSVGRELLEAFVGRIHASYNSIYALMFLLIRS